MRYDQKSQGPVCARNKTHTDSQVACRLMVVVVVVVVVVFLGSLNHSVLTQDQPAMAMTL